MFEIHIIQFIMKLIVMNPSLLFCASFLSYEEDYMLSTLHLSDITAEDFNANFTCVIEHPAGADFGWVMLIPGEP